MKNKVIVACSAAFAAAFISANAAVFDVGDTMGYGGIGVGIGLGPSVATFGTGTVLGQGGTGTGLPAIATGTSLLLAPALAAGLVPVTIWDDGSTSFTAHMITVTATGGGYFNVDALGTVTKGADSAPATFSLALTPIGGTAVGFYGAVTTVVPEPSTYALLAGLGLVGFAGYRRFRS